VEWAAFLFTCYLYLLVVLLLLMEDAIEPTAVYLRYNHLFLRVLILFGAKSIVDVALNK
jgi:hypothetical protein